MPASMQRSLTKPLEPSSTAAALDGPRARMPAASSTSHKPAHQLGIGGDHGEIDSRFLRANLARPAKSVAAIGTHSATCAMPGIAGGAIELCQQRAFRQRPGQRMLAAAGTHQQNFHSARLAIFRRHPVS